MRNQPLTGYVLHQKPYGENRSLVYFFSQEFGVVHGIGKKNLPLFIPIQLFANGKNALKNFSQSQVLNFNQTLTGQGLFAGMYLNEIILKLVLVEEPLSDLWQAYQMTITKIAQLFQDSAKHANDLTILKWHLRQFETLLFEQLGYGLDFSVDSLGENIQTTKNYRYQLQLGFVPVAAADIDKAEVVLAGEQLILWQKILQAADLFDSVLLENPNPTKNLLNQMGIIYRHILDNLLNYQQLQSRELWRQFLQYQ